MSDEPLDPLDAMRRKAPPSQPPRRPATVTPINGVRLAAWLTTALTNEALTMAATPEGGRNHQLNVSAYSLGGYVGPGQLTEDQVVEGLWMMARRAGLDDHEIEKILPRSVREGAAKPRPLPEMDDDGYDIPPVTSLGPVDQRWTTPDPVVDPSAEKDFWQSRNLLTHVFDFAQSRRAAPWAVLGVLLARIVTATGPHIVLPPMVGGKASLNQFVALVGRSGAGKGAAISAARDCVDLGRTIVVVKTGSGEGISHSYQRRDRKGETHSVNTAVLFEVPEVDTLTALGSRQGATLMPELRSAWSGESLGFAYADPTKRLHLAAHSYRLCLVAGVQPRRAGALLNDADAGTPQRFIWLSVHDPEAPDLIPATSVQMRWPEPTWGLFRSASADELISMNVCTAATTAIDLARLLGLRNAGDPLDSHRLLAQVKVAAALGLADGRLDVNDEDWELSKVVMARSAATRASVQAELSDAKKEVTVARAVEEADRTVVVGDRIADAPLQRVMRNVTRRLAGVGADGMGARAI